MCHVGHTIIDGGTPLRRVRDCVNLRMDRRLFVAIPHYGMVFCPRQETVVAHTDEAVVFDEDTTNLESVTRGSHRCELGSLHEVFVPRDSGFRFLGSSNITNGTTRH